MCGGAGNKNVKKKKKIVCRRRSSNPMPFDSNNIVCIFFFLSFIFFFLLSVACFKYYLRYQDGRDRVLCTVAQWPRPSLIICVKRIFERESNAFRRFSHVFSALLPVERTFVCYKIQYLGMPDLDSRLHRENRVRRKNVKKKTLLASWTTLWARPDRWTSHVCIDC